LSGKFDIFFPSHLSHILTFSHTNSRPTLWVHLTVTFAVVKLLTLTFTLEYNCVVVIKHLEFNTRLKYVMKYLFSIIVREFFFPSFLFCFFKGELPFTDFPSNKRAGTQKTVQTMGEYFFPVNVRFFCTHTHIASVVFFSEKEHKQCEELFFCCRICNTVLENASNNQNDFYDFFCSFFLSTQHCISTVHS
jgi:hypothetical protein